MVWCSYCKKHNHSLYSHDHDGVVVNCRKSIYNGRHFPSVDFFKDVLGCECHLDGSCYSLPTYLAVASELFNVDNKLYPEDDYKIRTDEDVLFPFVSEKKLKRKTISAFTSLLDNYEQRRGVREHVTKKERKEEYDFLRLIQTTPPMKMLFGHLRQEGLISGNQQDFVEVLHQIWFKMYGDEDISAFEHIFVGEISCDEHHCRTIGLHNWIQYYLEQEEGNIDYQGTVGYTPDSDDHIVTITFDWNGTIKPKSSMFVGTTPEFELALYTLLYFCGDPSGHNPIWIGEEKVDVFCRRENDRLVTAYPIHLVN